MSPGEGHMNTPDSDPDGGRDFEQIQPDGLEGPFVGLMVGSLANEFSDRSEQFISQAGEHQAEVVGTEARTAQVSA